METGRRAGMRQMDYSVLELWRDGIIDDDVALANIRNRILHKQINEASSGMAVSANDNAQ